MKKLFMSLAVLAIVALAGVAGCSPEVDIPKHTASIGSPNKENTHFTGVTLFLNEDAQNMTVISPEGEVIFTWKKEASE